MRINEIGTVEDSKRWFKPGGQCAGGDEGVRSTGSTALHVGLRPGTVADGWMLCGQ